MTSTSSPVLDQHGRVMFSCRSCGAPITTDDFFEWCLRLPEPGETRDDYCDAELIDAAEHIECLRAARAG
jgi:hypothetical protein